MAEEKEPAGTLTETFEAFNAKLSEAHQERGRLHFAAVGAVASAWSTFELLLDAATLVLGNIPRQIGYCLTAQVIGAARKLDAYIAIARLRGANRFMKELDQFAKVDASNDKSRQ